MTIPAPTPISSGGGGGSGGLNVEADVLLMRDSANDTLFLRRFPRDVDGVPGTAVDTQLDGSTAYVLTGSAVPVSTLPLGPAGTVTPTRVPVSTTHNTTAGAALVSYAVIAAGVTLDGEALPVGFADTIRAAPGGTLPALAFVTDGTGDVLVIEVIA